MSRPGKVAERAKANYLDYVQSNEGGNDGGSEDAMEILLEEESEMKDPEEPSFDGDSELDTKGEDEPSNGTYISEENEDVTSAGSENEEELIVGRDQSRIVQPTDSSAPSLV